MKLRRQQLACLLGAAFGLCMWVNSASAGIIKATYSIWPWGNGLDYTTTFHYVIPNGDLYLHGNSLSGIDRGNPVLLADLISYTPAVPAGTKPGVRALGITQSGAIISTCDTGTDYSTAQNVTVVDNSGCQGAAGHTMYHSVEF